ncbi:uncharacterized protein LOC111640340 [Centruroides sculpturatus]|uniref:uncharacterized protein LOC111627060 n=1 Tax=Centruroides sculpturatus TaxID=218467 RepID=UPI000C6DAE04|nr:uncharacterized protein LOC111627060 [Centruroides sculpturatus]XP_023242123.1 uncharacterized protein LOC111640340 [Centruroides sculpturatus]
MFLVISLLFVNLVRASEKPVIFPTHSISHGSLHPRTFYLTNEQENEVIRRVVCEDFDCPFFTVERDHPNFMRPSQLQQRNYRESKFLFSSDRQKCNATKTLDLAMSKLTAYRQGSNAREKVYPATQPVLVQIDQFSTVRSSNPWCRLTFTAGFYTPHYWGIPAAPLEASLKFLQLNENFPVFVHTFTGSIERHLLNEVEIFRENLEKLQLCYKSIRFYLALYDIPVLKDDSRHEIWFEKC